LRHVPAPLQTAARGEEEIVALAGVVAAAGTDMCLPDWVFGLPKHQVGLFVRHLWAIGGSVRDRISYVSSGRRLVDGLARLLLRFNVFTRITAVGDGGWRLDVDDADNQKRFCSGVGLLGTQGVAAARALRRIEGARTGTSEPEPGHVWERLGATLSAEHRANLQLTTAGLARPEGSGVRQQVAAPSPLSRVATILDTADLDVVATNDVCWDEIVEIEPLGERDVYDATVMGNHNFVANGIALHNSLEQDADMVILLHREDAYEKESTRPGEGDLIVAKHRAGPTDTIVVAFQGHYSRFVDMQQS
jgi:replicative DNA helicase